MLYEDIIMSGGEITKQAHFTLEGKEAFFLFLSPKTEDVSNSTTLNVKLSRNKVVAAFPFVAGMWNPVLVNQLNVTSTDLANYRIFWGATL